MERHPCCSRPPGPPRRSAAGQPTPTVTSSGRNLSRRSDSRLGKVGVTAIGAPVDEAGAGTRRTRAVPRESDRSCPACPRCPGPAGAAARELPRPAGSVSTAGAVLSGFPFHRQVFGLPAYHCAPGRARGRPRRPQNARVDTCSSARQRRLARAIAAAGTICAIGVSTAATASAAGTWSGRIGPVPHAFTNAAPAMTSITFGNRRQDQHPGRLGRADWRRRFLLRLAEAGRPAELDRQGGHSGAPRQAPRRPFPPTVTPTAARPSSRLWRSASGGLIRYAQGETRADRKIAWTAVRTMPTGSLNATDAAPAVFFAQDRYLAVVAYRGPHDHIRYFSGIAGAAAASSGPSRSWISPSAVSGSSPTIAELQTSTGHGQRLRVLEGPRPRRSATPPPPTR